MNPVDDKEQGDLFSTGWIYDLLLDLVAAILFVAFAGLTAGIAYGVWSQ